MNQKDNLKIPIQIMKFGGSCLIDENSFKQIKQITDLYKNDSKIYVLSALHGTTELLIRTSILAHENKPDQLSELIKTIETRHSNLLESIFEQKSSEYNEVKKKLHEIMNELINVLEEVKEFGITPYFTDYIMSFGEKLSNFLLSSYLSHEKYDVVSFKGEDIIITNDRFNNALPNLSHTKRRIKERMFPSLFQGSQSPIICITGFIGRNKIGYTTTLGRGGSDFTATIIARCLYELNPELEINIILWKDVDGILTSNPNFVSTTHLIPKLSYQEAKEMAFVGAKVLHPKCLEIIEQQNIPIEIKNFDFPNRDHHTVISQNFTPNKIKVVNIVENMELISISSPTLISVPGFLGKVFTLLGKNGVNINMMSQSCSQIGISFTIERFQLRKVLDLLTSDKNIPSEWISVSHRPVGIIAIIGNDLFLPDSIIKISRSFSHLGISPLSIAQNDNGMNLSITLPESSLKQAVNLINDSFVSSEENINEF